MHHEAEEIGAANVRAWLVRSLPGRAAPTSLRKLGQGLDHVAWLIDDALVLRFGGDPRREARILEHVRGLPLRTPEVIAVDDEALACSYLPGTSLLNRALPVNAAMHLGAFLEAVHDVVETDDLEVDNTSLDDWLEDARTHFRQIEDALSFNNEHQRTAIERFLFEEAPPPASARRVFCHNDLGAEHILVNEHDGELTGVIDWADAALADPAIDVARLYRDFGGSAFPIDSYSKELQPRIVFYARCCAIEDLAFGGAHREAALRSLTHLFPHQSS